MSILTPGGLPETDRLGKPLLPSYRNMIRLEGVIEDEAMPMAQRVDIALHLLYGPQIPHSYDTAWNELMWFYRGGEEEGGDGGKGKKPGRVYDFEEDAPFIYAAFRQAYGIDVSCSGPFLHWWEFRALFYALPEDTQMAQRMYYRGLDTKDLKGKYKQDMEARKRAVALKGKKTVAKTLAQVQQSTLRNVEKRFEQAEKLLQGGE